MGSWCTGAIFPSFFYLQGLRLGLAHGGYPIDIYWKEEERKKGREAKGKETKEGRRKGGRERRKKNRWKKRKRKEKRGGSAGGGHWGQISGDRRTVPGR